MWSSGLGRRGGERAILTGGGFTEGSRESAMVLKKFEVSVRRFDPAAGLESGEEFALPVDSPDEEHAASAAMPNAIAFTPKVQDGVVAPVAFCCIGVRERG